MVGMLTIIHQNVRSMRKNFDLFLSELVARDILPDIIVLSEIWINSDESNLYTIPDYNLYLKCNDQYRAGGVAVYIKDSFKDVKFVELKCISADALLVSLSYLNTQLHILAIYRLLFCSIDLFVNELKQCFNDRNNLLINAINLIWIGDININISDDSSYNSDVDNYLALMSRNGLEGLIKEPTRITEQSQTCIDHVFVRVANKNMLQVIATVMHADITDHSLLRVEVRVVGRGRGSGERASPASPPSPRCRTDIAQLGQLIDSADWSPVYVQVDASSAFDTFFDIFQNLKSQSRVECVATIPTYRKLKPWITDFICMKIKWRNHVFKLMKRHPNNDHLKTYYRKIKNKLQNDIRNVKNNYYRNKFTQCKGDSRATWKLINRLTGQSKVNSKEINLEINNEITNDPCIVANEFNGFFLDILNQLNLTQKIPRNFSNLRYKDSFSSKQEPSSIYIYPVLPVEILKEINSLKTNTTPGIDNISSSLIKNVGTKIVDILTYLINFSIETGVFPSKLKSAVVIPIFKGGKEDKCNNYRPISLLSCFSKIYEKIIKQRLIAFLEKTGFFSDNQYGFRSGMNTEHALINFMNDVCIGLNESKCVSGLFLDIKKAFDTVDHNILLVKLFKCGVRGVALEWFKSYLIGRTQCVRVNQVNSDMGEIRSGVPQGSVLGAILFIVYINDLCNAKLNGKVTSFADDTALCYTEKTWESTRVSMTEDLEALQWWFTTNRMLLSAEKTKFINFNLKKDINLFNHITYKCADCLQNQSACKTSTCATVERTSIIKYLGLFVDSEVNWKSQIRRLKGKINNLLRYFYFLRNMADQQIMRTLYFALVQSRIEYGIVIWGNAYNTHIKPIHTLQKHFIRLISHKTKSDHSRPIFNQLKILPIKHLYVFKVLKQFFERSGNIPQNDNVYRKRLRSCNNFLVPKPSNTFFTRSYYFIAPRIFNSLPLDIKLSQNRHIFSTRLKKLLFEMESVESLLMVLK